MKKSLLLFAISLLPFIAFSQIKYDTLSVKQIGEGIFHYTIEAPAVPWTLDVVEIDITKASTKMETVKAQDSYSGYEKTSSMSKRKSYEGHEVVAAINGDFYGGGTPTNAQVIKGEIMKGPMNREVYGYAKDKKMFIHTTTYEGQLHADGDTYAISGINKARNADELIYYNHYYGDNTGTNEFGTELILSAVDEWVVNGSVRAVVMDKTSSGSAQMTDSTFVLSGHGASKTILDGIAEGDTIAVEHKLLPGFDNLKEVVGGSHKFLDDGANVGGWPERHPRSAVGFNADTTKVYLVTVDGRQSTSAGMTLKELGSFMSGFGAEHALNLDGGGSTTLVTHHEVVNDPSDGSGERAVANALMVVSDKQKTGVLENLNMSPSFLKIYKGETYTFSAEGSDENFYPVELDSSKMNFSLSSDFNASITQDGKFSAGNAADTGFVYLDYEGQRDTAHVIIKGITKFSLFPKFAVTDSSYEFKFFNESFDFDGKSHDVPNRNIDWTVGNSDIGIISDNGVFKGMREGTTSIIGTHDGVSDTTEVEVQIGQGVNTLSSFESLENWTLGGENIDLANSSISIVDSVSSEGEKALKLDYEFVYDNNPDVWAYLETDIPVYGVPDSITVDAKTDGKKHLIELRLTDNNDEEFYVRVKKWAENTAFDNYPAVMDDILPINAFNTFYYPVKIKKLGIKLASDQQTGTTYSGTIYIDNLQLTYPNQTAVSNEREDDISIPDKISLKQNYPNPFNPTTKISFSIPNSGYVELKVFDILGREVALLADERLQAGNHTVTFDAENFSSGIYLYQLTTQDISISKKMTLIK